MVSSNLRLGEASGPHPASLERMQLQIAIRHHFVSGARRTKKPVEDATRFWGSGTVEQVRWWANKFVEPFGR